MRLYQLIYEMLYYADGEKKAKGDHPNAAFKPIDPDRAINRWLNDEVSQSEGWHFYGDEENIWHSLRAGHRLHRQLAYLNCSG